MASKKKGSKKYGPTAGRTVKKVMGERKRGTLRSGRSKKKVKSRAQAIAIGLSEARAAGGKVPRKSAGKTGRKKASKSTARATGRKKSAKKSGKKARKKSSSR